MVISKQCISSKPKSYICV